MVYLEDFRSKRQTTKTVDELFDNDFRQQVSM